MFEITDRESIIAPEDCGLINTVCSLNGWLDDAAELRGFFTPPFFSRSFRLRVRFNNRMVRAQHYTWHPACLTRQGSFDGIRIRSELVLLKHSRAALMRVTLSNPGKKTLPAELQYEARGIFGCKENWRFGQISVREEKYAERKWKDGILYMRNESGEFSIGSTWPVEPSMPVCSGVLNGGVRSLAPGKKIVFYTVVALGKTGENRPVVKRALAQPEKCFQEALDDWQEREKHLFSRMPKLESDHKQLVHYYQRSLLHLLLNEWQIPSFKLHPHYGTGSILGDTICCYMWNYGGPWQLWSLLSPESARDHLRNMLTLDLGNCYAFYADDGKGFGPYYPINQEKVIFLAYAYVMQTGDVGFLHEMLEGRTILEHLVEQACFRDDMSKRATLTDYGLGNDHLELRSPTIHTDPMVRYDGLCPDLNLRRCVNYRLVDILCKIAGKDPGVDLAARGEALKKLVHERLYSREKGWFRTIDPEGREVFRYTIQMFKALGWGDWALYPEAEEALIKHLMNEKEFLGRFGLHSLSKLDPAYYEDDVDNGGPGACVSFPAAIIQRLYQGGRPKLAEKIWSRLLWMGELLPYWGDSQLGDVQDYRRETELKCDIEGAEPAQALIFGMFGIRFQTDFSLDITPHLPESAKYIRLRNLRLAGRTITITATAKKTTVVCDDRTYSGKPGETIHLPAKSVRKKVQR